MFPHKDCPQTDRVLSAGEQRLRVQYFPRLTRWVAARLPPDSDAQAESLAAAVLDRALAAGNALAFSPEGAFMLHLRQELARMVEIAPNSSLARAVGTTEILRYEQALDRLPQVQRQAIIGHLEMTLTCDELVGILGGSPGETTIETFVGRALIRLAEEMAHSEAASHYAGR